MARQRQAELADQPQPPAPAPPPGYTPTPFDIDVLNSLVQLVRPIPGIHHKVVALRDRIKAALPPQPAKGE